jgi:hypothetical protein
MSAGGGGGPAVNTKHGGKHTKKIKGRNLSAGGLMLTSMLDILTTILFFLMQNYTQVVSDFNIGKDMQLPYSSALQPPQPALQLIVSEKNIMLDNQPIADIVNGDVDRKAMFRDGVTIVPLAQALKAQKDRSLFVEKHNDAHSFTGSIVMQADKDLTFNVLKKVIFTAGMSDFVMFKMAVMKKDEI